MDELAHPPVISLENFEERKHEIKEQIMKAASTMGFFYITGTTISEELIARVWEVNAKYFEMSDEAKKALPQLDWGTLKLLGYDLNADSGATHMLPMLQKCFALPGHAARAMCT